MKILLLTLFAAVAGMATPRVTTPAAAPPVTSQALAKPTPAAKSDREKIVATALREVGTQERTGNNDGPVDKYLAAVGLSKTRNPYCAAFVYWVGKNAGLSRNPYPRSAWSPDFLPAGSTSKIASARPGDTFGVYHASKGRIAHTGLVRGWQGRYLWTLEANTSPGQSTGEADRNGDGVWSKLRDPRTIHRVKSWLP